MEALKLSPPDVMIQVINNVPLVLLQDYLKIIFKT